MIFPLYTIHASRGFKQKKGITLRAWCKISCESCIENKKEQLVFHQLVS